MTIAQVREEKLAGVKSISELFGLPAAPRRQLRPHNGRNRQQAIRPARPATSFRRNGDPLSPETERKIRKTLFDIYKTDMPTFAVGESVGRVYEVEFIPRQNRKTDPILPIALGAIASMGRLDSMQYKRSHKKMAGVIQTGVRQGFEGWIIKSAEKHGRRAIKAIEKYLNADELRFFTRLIEEAYLTPAKHRLGLSTREQGIRALRAFDDNDCSHQAAALATGVTQMELRRRIARLEFKAGRRCIMHRNNHSGGRYSVTPFALEIIKAGRTAAQ